MISVETKVDDKALRSILSAVSLKKFEGAIDAASDEISLKFVGKVESGFRQSKDQYGTPWTKLKKRKGQPLLDTGRMVGSVKSASTKKSSADIGVYTDYAGHHQAGVAHLKQRMMVPGQNQGLPKI